MSGHEQIRQSRHDEQAIAVLHHAAIADLGKAKDALDDEEGMFDLGTHTRLSTVLLLFPLRESPVAKALLVSKVTCLRCAQGDQFLLAGVSRVSIYAPLVAMEQLRQRMLVVLISRCSNHRMDQLGLAVYADMRLHAEIPLVALFGLVHLRIAGIVLVLGRGRRIDDRRVNDGAGRYLQPLGLQMPANFLEDALA